MSQDSVHDRPDPGLPSPKRWKRLAAPDSSGAGGEVGVPQGTPGTCSRRQQAWGIPVSPAEGTSALALVRFKKFRCMLRTHEQTRVR